MSRPTGSYLLGINRVLDHLFALTVQNAPREPPGDGRWHV